LIECLLHFNILGSFNCCFIPREFYNKCIYPESRNPNISREEEEELVLSTIKKEEARIESLNFNARAGEALFDGS
jgi:hypothetical protein